MKLTTPRLKQIIKEELEALQKEVDEEEPSTEPAAGAEAGEEEEGKPDAPQDVSNFAEKLQSSGLDEYIMKINKPDELYGLISVILKTALESESPINEKMIAQVLKKAFKGEWV